MALLRAIKLLFNYFSTVKIPQGGDNAQVGHCIFKAKHVACKIAITGLRCFLNLKRYTTFSTALPLP